MSDRMRHIRASLRAVFNCPVSADHRVHESLDRLDEALEERRARSKDPVAQLIDGLVER